MQRFEGKVVVITGGAAGIGLATARRIASEGGRTALLDWSAEDLEKALAALRDDGADCVAVHGDAASRTDCDSIVGMALERWDRMDAVVANAGIRTYGSLLDATDADWDRTMRVNLRGAVNICAAGTEAMRVCRCRGALVLVASMNALIGRDNMPLYDAAKAGVLSVTRSLAVELARDGIRVNSVCPGFTVTDFHIRRAAEHGRSASDLRATQCGLFKRPAEPGEIAAAIAFLASGDATYITGTNLMVDAGRHAT